MMTLRRQTLSSISDLMPLTHPQRACPLTAYVDDILRARLLNEQRAGGDTDISDTITRKLTHAVHRLPAYTTADLDWRPVARSALPVEVLLDEAIMRALSGHAERLGFTEDVLTTTLLHDSRFASSPQSGEQPDPPLQLGYLRTERGRGRIYGMYFEMPGYQYAFLRCLGQDAFSAREILDIALLSLAREVCSRSPIGGIVVSPEAVNFARKMVKLEASVVRYPRSASNR